MINNVKSLNIEIKDQFCVTIMTLDMKIPIYILVWSFLNDTAWISLELLLNQEEQVPSKLKKHEKHWFACRNKNRCGLVKMLFTKSGATAQARERLP